MPSYRQWERSGGGGDQAADAVEHEWQAVLAVGVRHEVRGDKNLRIAPGKKL